MSGLAQARQATRFAFGLYADQAQLAYWALVRRDLLSRLLVARRAIDPYPLYAQMRRRGRLLPTRLGNYSTTSYRLCNEVLRNRSFAVMPSADSVNLSQRPSLDLSLLELNPPDHTRIRRLAAPAFTPRRIHAYEPLVADAIHHLLDDAMPSRRLEVMSAFAAPLPIAVMTRLLGLPDEPGELRRVGSTLARALDGIRSLKQARELLAADRQLRASFARVLSSRSGEQPNGDLISQLAVHRDHELAADELAALVRLLLVAGFETTVNAIGNALRWLLTDRRQWELLVECPDRAAAAAEEVLRFDPPVQQTARVALADTELDGVLVRQDRWIVTILAAAGRDPEVYADADRFDITRPSAAEHLAFSGGIHYCLGSALARLELTEALRALALRFPRMHLAEPVTMRPGVVLRGPQRLVVDLGRAA